VALLKIDESTCTRCGLCAATCPGYFIYSRENSFPDQRPEIDMDCVRCGHCVAVCPSGSLTHLDLPLEQCTAIEKSLDVSFAQVAQLIKGRRSIREFKNSRVLPEDIERIIEVAHYAPTGHNDQDVRWLVITNPPMIKRLSTIGLEWMRWTVTNIPGMEPMIGGLLKLQESGKDAFLRDAPAVVFTFGPKNSPISSIDCVSAAAYFDLTAVGAGLGCCWNGLLLVAATSFPAMIEAVAIPKDFTPYGCLMVGYPKYRYQRVPPRKPASIIIRS